jgi:hypothetical protein
MQLDTDAYHSIGDVRVTIPHEEDAVDEHSEIALTRMVSGDWFMHSM